MTARDLRLVRVYRRRVFDRKSVEASVMSIVSCFQLPASPALELLSLYFPF
jgi:hypothetical protein